jgi:hypothetical protein
VFRSVNGVIEIDPAMVMLADAVRISRKPLRTPFSVTWRTFNQSLDEWHCRPADAANPSGQVTLVQQLRNDRHVLEILPREGVIQLERIIIHRPELR